MPDQPTYEEAHKLRVALAIVKETLRMFPIATFAPRVAMESKTLNGIQIPKGVLLLKRN